MGAANVRHATGLGADILNVIRNRLIDLINPIAEQKMGMAAPAILRWNGHIIAREIAMWWLDRPSSRDITVILFLERGRVIFDMIETALQGTS